MSVMQVAVNPDPDSRLPFLLRLPLGDGLVFRVGGTWPREKAVYCYPVPVSEWPTDPEIVEQVLIRSCRRRGAAIDLVVDRGRESRSQLVYTTARGREAIFWQAPRTRKQSRPAVRRPTARADGLAEMQVRWPNVPIMFAQTRPLAEEWTYRYLAAATAWIGPGDTGEAAEASTSTALDPPPATGARDGGPAGPEPSAAAVRHWARRAGLDVPDRGRLPRAVWAAWHAAHNHD